MNPIKPIRSFFTLVANTVTLVRSTGVASKAKLGLLAVLILPAPFLEVFGITLFLPLIDLIQNQENTAVLNADGLLWKNIHLVAEWLGAPVTVPVISLFILGLISLRLIIQYLRAILTARMAENIVVVIRSRLIGSILLANASILGRMGVGRTTDVGIQQAARCRASLPRLIDLANLIWISLVYATALLTISPPMTILGILVFSLGGLVSLPLIRRVRRLSTEAVAENGHFGAQIVQTLASWRTIKLFRAEIRVQGNIHDSSSRIGDINYAREKISALIPLQLAFGAIFAALLVLNVVAEIGAPDTGGVMIFTLMVIRILPLTQNFLNIVQGFVALQANMAVVLGRTSLYKSAAEIAGGPRSFGKLCKGIRFDDVHYQHQDTLHPALRGASAFFPAHKITVVSGPSGAGKSTLVDLLPRLVLPSQGTITFDDSPLEVFSISSLRHSIGFLDQSPAMINGTIEETLRYGDPKVSMEILREACRIACALDFIETLPNGFATKLGEDSIGLSGGQLQRLALARALVLNPEILILDEPTSAVDTKSELAIFSALRTAADTLGTTVIMITHRPVPQWFSDQTITLEKGMITDARSHQRIEPPPTRSSANSPKQRSKTVS